MLEVKCDGDCIFSQLSLVTNEEKIPGKRNVYLDVNNM